MANIVGLKETEYTDLESGLKNAHDDYIGKIEAVVKQVDKLNTKAGGFYLPAVSPNVDAMLTQVSQLKTRLEGAFTAHEQIIKGFQNTVDNYDIKL